MSWAAFTFVALWIAYLVVWLAERGRLQSSITAIFGSLRQLSRGQLILLLLVFAWAVRVGGSKGEGGQQGGQTEEQQMENFNTETNGSYAASSSTNLCITGIMVTNGIVELQIQPPSNVACHVDIFYEEFLTNSWWSLAGTTEQAMSEPFLVQFSCTMTSVFFNAGNADVDTDSDSIPDDREILTYHTNPLLADTDGDGVSDYAELFTYGTNPLARDSDGDGTEDDEQLLAGAGHVASATSVRYYYDADDRVAVSYAGASPGCGAVAYAITPAGNVAPAERSAP